MFALWWLLKGNGGVSVWVFQEGDLNQPGFSQKVNAMFHFDRGLQRTYPWILFGPYLALMAWYFPLERDRLRRNLPLNAAICLTFAWACHAIDLRRTVTRPNLVVVGSDPAPGQGRAPSGTNGSESGRSAGHYAKGDRPSQSTGPLPEGYKRPSSPPRLPKASLRSTILDLLAYGAITGLAHSVNFHRRLRERERLALFLESKLANARLNTLKAQLQPHFLFNSLNAIAALLRRDPRLAETTLVALSELLRLALSQSERQEGTLREELEFVQRYLEIQQTRFGDKLRVEQEIEPGALDCVVPTLVLQPLVENAIRHGIESAENGGLVRVSAFRKDGKLVLTVEDDGVGLTNGKADSSGPEYSAGLSVSLPAAQIFKTGAVLARGRTGIGLANLRERLHALYGVRQKLELRPRATGGTIVRVSLPVSESESKRVRENQ
ncbi:MAG TPA: sensor histidine kinase [Candidatus Saccharimonadales bacterium]|nr:sensor histidine kinase [Candidatus Saccharimonadales bacterium]